MSEVEVGDVARFLRVTPVDMRHAIRTGELRGRVIGQLAYVNEGTSRLLTWAQGLHENEANNTNTTKPNG